MGMLQPLGQPRDDPDRGLDGAGLVQEQARGLVLILDNLDEGGPGRGARVPTSRENKERNRETADGSFESFRRQAPIDVAGRVDEKAVGAGRSAVEA